MLRSALCAAAVALLALAGLRPAAAHSISFHSGQACDYRITMVEQLNRLHAQALNRIDETLGRGQWHRDAMDGLIKDTLGQAIPALVGSITSQAVTAALSGDQAEVARLKARADSLKSSIDQQVDQRSDELGRRAQAMCPHMDHLMALQQAWQFRVDGQQRLELLQPADDDDQHSGSHDRHAAP
ncbi:DUF2884 family protein [Oleiagrimonas sp. C23AA]|uniref:DUF2884 family protein n=1 Tax=Oleiagrimonas sp. C23AA TaxID=2719047 RepID=UPI001422701D|nr:DUF2884 family protein [Oleiagrimonas sp. C23AA]NII11926.1 YggN family protein [Oleiagrimonas sp. C23AA]